MAQTEHSQTFDNLVSGITADERKVLLDKMKAGTSSEGAKLENKESIPQDSGAVDLNIKLKSESIFLRFWLWLKAVFSNTTIQEEYNKSLVAEIARSIDHHMPGLVDYKHELLTMEFYNRLVELKNASDAFKNVIDSYEADRASFYVLLGSLVMPDFGEEMNRQADPYTYSFQKEINSEMRTSLLRKMDDLLSKIPSDKKNEIYAGVRSLEWLRHFTKLPFQSLISKFTPFVGEQMVCQFDKVANEIVEMANVFCNGHTLTDEVVQALYIFDSKKLSSSDMEDIDRGKTGTDFMDVVAQKLSDISLFINTVPMRSVACVVYNNATFIPEAPGGGEDWFIKYKAQWKKLFDRKWEEWLNDSKKEKIKVKLREYFGYTSMPALRDRPWADLWGGIKFSYDLAIGFVSYFMKDNYVKYLKTLKILSLEGDFAIKDNRNLLSELLASFDDVTMSLTSLEQKLLSDGEYGSVFERYLVPGSRTQAALTRVNQLMEEIEMASKTVISLFGENCRTLSKLLNGLMAEKIQSGFGNLVNISTIQGSNNKKFRQDLEEVRVGIDHALESLADLESLDKGIK